MSVCIKYMFIDENTCVLKRVASLFFVLPLTLFFFTFNGFSCEVNVRLEIPPNLCHMINHTCYCMHIRTTNLYDF